MTGTLQKQFKRSFSNKSILGPKPELEGMERKFDYKKYFAELKNKEGDK